MASNMQQKQAIYVASGGVHDPSWNPHTLVSRRLRDACTLHASRLAERTTIESSLCTSADASAGTTTTNTSKSSNNDNNNNSNDNNNNPTNELLNQVIHPLARISFPRSFCPQPPLDDAITGGGSSISCDVHFSGMNVRLDPLERAAPHRIVVPEHNNNNNNNDRGELDGTNYNAQWKEQRSATWNAITALATLCDEVEELDKQFQTQIVPSIVLFSAEDYEDSSTVSSSSAFPLANDGGKIHGFKKDILDEEARRKRESALLARMGKFLPALQLASNGTARLRRLVKNMVVQLGGCATPAAIPFYFDGKDGDDSKLDGDDAAAAAGDGKEDGSAMNGSGMSSHGGDAKKGMDEQSAAAAAAARGGGSNKNASSGEQSPVFGKGVPLFRLGRAISTALRILIAVDMAVASNVDLQEAWTMYKDVVMEWSEEKRTENKLDAEFESFERMMVQLDFNLLSSRSFVATIEQNFDPRGRFQAARFPLHEEIRSILMTLYGQYCERINTEHETTERLDCVGVYAMYVLYRHLLPPNIIPDAKLHKSLWSVFPAMCPILELYGPLHFIPREFMMLHAPYEAVKGCSADIPHIRSESATLVSKWDGSFMARVSKIRLEALGWLAAADSELSPTVHESHSNGGGDDDFNLASSVGSIERATSCILRGLKIAHSASILLRGQLIAHRSLNLGFPPSHILPLLSLVEVLKSIEKMLRVRRRSAVLSFQRSTLKMIASNILKRFDKVRSFVDQCSASIDFNRSPVEARCIARVSACLSALEGVLKGTSSFSPIRRYSISFSIAACMDSMILQVFTPEDLAAVEGHLKDLNQISSIEDVLSGVCDCSFLYFYRDLFPEFIESLYQANLNSAFSRIQLVLSALSDPERIIKHVQHLEKDETSGLTACFEGYQKYVLGVMKEEYIDPICEMIEVDLRLAVHSKNAENSKNPSTSCVDKRLRNFINSPSLHVCQNKISVKTEVELYLEKTFYNLCTVNLNDCNTYTEMRIIAKERYGLNLLDPYLPDGSHEHHVDFVGETLRDMNLFVSRYNYNMIEQSFVERRPERGAKFLRTLNIKCVSAALKQHGLGVVGAAVNVSYKLLAKKFQLFTQFLADDHVKSLVSKEGRWLSNERSEGNTIYPFNRASAFAQEIKKLGQTDSGGTGLDECRILLAEMGNIIALVRMIRAAKRKVLGDRMPFLPSSCSSTVDRALISLEEKTSAMPGMDESISAILNKPDPDFVRAYVNVFKGVIIKSDNSFMSGFFCMVPALCLCWMEASLQGKEMMHKKNITGDGYYTDDGFAVGLAFSLCVLGQVKQYESLNWFKSIQNKYAADEEDLMEKKSAEEVKINAKMAASKQSSWFSSGADENVEQDDDDEMTILKMMGKRLEGNRREMAMLFFSLHGAQSFFKDLRSN